MTQPNDNELLFTGNIKDTTKLNSNNMYLQCNRYIYYGKHENGCDYCIYDNTIYCCIAAVTSGSAFNVNQWKATTLWSLVNDIEVNMGTISSLPVTKSVSDLLPNYKVKEFILGEPSAQVGDWAVNTAWNNSSSTGTITVSGTISGSTTLKVLVGPCKTVTAS
jgi:hypothetical protein